MPWEYLYYVATVELRWSTDQFWEGSLRTLIALRDEHAKAERANARTVGYMVASYMNGVDPDGVESDPKALRKKEFEMGNALW